VIAIIAILAAILFRFSPGAREGPGHDLLVECPADGTAAVMYAQDYDEFYPGDVAVEPFAIKSQGQFVYRE